MMDMPFTIPRRVKKPTVVFMACRPDSFAHCIVAAPTDKSKRGVPSLFYFTGPPEEGMRCEGQLAYDGPDSLTFQFEHAVSGRTAIYVEPHPLRGLVYVETWETIKTELSLCNLSDYNFHYEDTRDNTVTWSPNDSGPNLDIGLKLACVPSDCLKKLREVFVEHFLPLGMCLMESELDDIDQAGRAVRTGFNQLIGHAKPFKGEQPIMENRDTAYIPRHFLTMAQNLGRTYELTGLVQGKYEFVGSGVLSNIVTPSYVNLSVMLHQLRLRAQGLDEQRRRLAQEQRAQERRQADR